MEGKKIKKEKVNYFFTEMSSLAFRLADSGYDVWLGNSRGSYYGRNHVYLPLDSAKYWDFR